LSQLKGTARHAVTDGGHRMGVLVSWEVDIVS